MDEEIKTLGPSMTFIPECLGHPPRRFAPGLGAAASVRSCVRIVSRVSRCFFPFLEICTASCK